MDTTALGRSRRGHAGVADDDDVAGQPVPALPEQGGEVRRPGLLLALDQQLDRDGGGVAAGRGEVGAHAEQVEGDVALVVDGAAGVQLGAVRALDDGRLERRVHPELRRVDRLHVVVAVDERDGCVGVGAAATRRTPRAPRRSARSRRSGSRPGSAPRPARRRCAATSSACAGSAEIDGIRSQASRSACRSSRWARTKSRSGLVWLLLTGTDGSAALASTPCRESCCGSTSVT